MSWYAFISSSLVTHLSLFLFFSFPFKWFRKRLTYYIIFFVISHRNLLAASWTWLPWVWGMLWHDCPTGPGLCDRPFVLATCTQTSHHHSTVLAYPCFGHSTCWPPPLRMPTPLVKACLPACCCWPHFLSFVLVSGPYVGIFQWLLGSLSHEQVTCNKHWGNFLILPIFPAFTTFWKLFPYFPHKAFLKVSTRLRFVGAYVLCGSWLTMGPSLRTAVESLWECAVVCILWNPGVLILAVDVTSLPV